MKIVSYALPVLGTLPLLAFASSQPDLHGRKIVEREIPVAAFDSLSLRGSPTVRLVESDRTTVHVAADARVADFVRVYTVDGELRIHVPEDDYKAHCAESRYLGFQQVHYCEINVAVPMPKVLKALSLSGNGDIRIDAPVSGDALSVSLDGNGDIVGQFPVSVRQLQLMLWGNGDIKLEALRVDRLEATIKGNGDIHLGGSASAYRPLVSGGGEIHADLLQIGSPTPLADVGQRTEFDRTPR